MTSKLLLLFVWNFAPPLYSHSLNANVHKTKVLLDVVSETCHSTHTHRYVITLPNENHKRMPGVTAFVINANTGSLRQSITFGLSFEQADIFFSQLKFSMWFSNVNNDSIILLSYNTTCDVMNSWQEMLATIDRLSSETEFLPNSSSRTLFHDFRVFCKGMCPHMILESSFKDKMSKAALDGTQPEQMKFAIYLDGAEEKVIVFCKDPSSMLHTYIYILLTMLLLFIIASFAMFVAYCRKNRKRNREQPIQHIENPHRLSPNIPIRVQNIDSNEQSELIPSHPQFQHRNSPSNKSSRGSNVETIELSEHIRKLNPVTFNPFVQTRKRSLSVDNLPMRKPRSKPRLSFSLPANVAPIDIPARNRANTSPPPVTSPFYIEIDSMCSKLTPKSKSAYQVPSGITHFAPPTSPPPPIFRRRSST